MTYQHMELEPFLEEAEAIRTLAENASNETAVRRRYDTLADQLDLAVTMLTLAMIRSYQDTGDQALAEEMAYATLLCTDMQDAYILLGRDVLSSPCGGFLRQPPQGLERLLPRLIAGEKVGDAPADAGVQFFSFADFLYFCHALNRSSDSVLL